MTEQTATETQDIEIDARQSRFQTSVEAQLICNRLSKAEVGESISYFELSEIVGFDVQIKRGPMDTARRICEREPQKIVFGVVFNEGLKRLNDTEIVATGNNAIRHIRKTARRAGQRIIKVDFETLPNVEKVKHNTFLGMLGVLRQMMTKKSILRLENATAEAAKRLPNRDVLQLFENGKG